MVTGTVYKYTMLFDEYEAIAKQLIYLHNSDLVFQGFANTKTQTPSSYSSGRVWIASETGTVFGKSVQQKQLIVDTGTGFRVENLDISPFIRAPYRFNQKIYSPSQQGYDINVIANNANFNPGAYTYNNITYFVWYDINMASYVNTYNHITGEISDPVYIRAGNDTHEHPTIIVTNDEYLLIVVESNHNEGLEIWRSDNKLDISSWTNVQNMTESYSYPHLSKMVDGSIVILGRYGNLSQSEGHYRTYMAISTDDGQNFSHIGYVSDHGTTNDPWAYVTTPIMSPDKEWLCMFNNVRDHDISLNDPRCYVMFSHYSTNFEVWGNIEYFTSNKASGFSKNIVNSGAITRSELDNNCLIEDAGTDATRTVKAASWDRHGNIHFIQSDGVRDQADSDFSEYLRSWNGGSWTKTDISQLVGADNDFPRKEEPQIGNLHSISPLEHYVYVNKLINGQQEIRRYVTFDAGKNWYLDTEITKSSSLPNYMPVINQNAHDSKEIFIYYAIDQGSYSDIGIATITANPGGLTLINSASESSIVNIIAIKDDAWSDGNGSPEIRNNELFLPDGSSTVQAIHFASRIAVGTWEFEFTRADASATNSLYFCILVPPGSSTLNQREPDDAYTVRIINDGTLVFRKNVSGSGTPLISTTWPNDNSKHTIKITRDSSGNFELFLDDVSQGTATDTDFTTAGYVHVGTNMDSVITINSLKIY